MWRTTLGVAAVAAVTMLAACSSGNSSDSGSSASGSCAPGVTDNSIKVGLLYPDTGVMASQFTGYRAGVNARFSVENAAGGVDGRKIDYAWQDDQSDPSGNLQGARELVAQKAFAVVQYTAVSQQSVAYLDKAGVPVIGAADQPGWAAHRNTFTVILTNQTGQSTTTIGDFIRQQGGTKAAVVVSFLSEIAKLYADGVTKSLQHAGIDAVTQDVDGTNAADVARKLISSGADTISPRRRSTSTPVSWTRRSPPGTRSRSPCPPSVMTRACSAPYGQQLAGHLRVALLRRVGAQSAGPEPVPAGDGELLPGGLPARPAERHHRLVERGPVYPWTEDSARLSYPGVLHEGPAWGDRLRCRRDAGQ